jgi:hypothetical protein
VGARARRGPPQAQDGDAGDRDEARRDVERRHDADDLSERAADRGAGEAEEGATCSERAEDTAALLVAHALLHERLHADRRGDGRDPVGGRRA